MLETVRTAIQLVTLVIGLVTLVTSIVYFKSGGYIMSIIILYSVHLTSFYTFRFWNIAHGQPNPLFINDWSTFLRLHTAVTVFVLSANIIMRKNGDSSK